MTRQQVVLCEYQAERQFNYLHRRMSWAPTPEAEDYWWRQIQDLGAALKEHREQ